MAEFGHKVVEFVKHHPYGTAAGIFAIGAAYILWSNSGSSGTATDNGQTAYASSLDAAQIQAGAQLQGMQIQAGAATALGADQLAAQQAGIQGQVDIAGIQADSSNYAAQLAEKLGEVQVGAQQSVANTASTLSAQVSEAQIAAAQNENTNYINSITAQNANANSTILSLATILNPPSVYSPSGAQAFVNTEYESLLGRAPDAAAGYWTTALQTGILTEQQVIQGITGSTEYQQRYAASAGHP